MPIKFGKSMVQINRETKKKTIVHEYIKVKTKQELIDAYNKEGIRPKLRQKVKNELVRRGGVVFTKIENTPTLEEALNS